MEVGLSQTSSSSKGSHLNNTTKQPAKSSKRLTENFAKVDTSSIDKQMWLVKVPHTLATAWRSAPEGTLVGQLTFTKGSVVDKKSDSTMPHVKQSLDVTLSSELGQAHPDVPSNYSVEAMTKKVPAMNPFTRHAIEEDEGIVSIHGTVSRTCSLQITRNIQYRQVCKSRLQDIVTSKQFVKPVDVSELSMRKQAYGSVLGGAGFGESVQLHGKRLLEAAERVQAGVASSDAKRFKFEGQPIRSVVFQLFSHQPYWTAKELRLASGRAEKEIRSMLHELCNYIKNGEHKGMWELKHEFQMQPTNVSGAASTSMVDHSSER
mmetsp:Transcript_11207/g.16129  ORF Transcript_11207/g.16129 Transcript_11207/m.16129 type:complete len:319 (-) Transcript_11207:50-1006(-)|eukprot:CAMPEP_0172425256 /NCGR_PEP_ID=MMETSP1064-20121228/31172_1 /TAXON_ID=202472 /ORGANISM="Aulacoseira subarctica , Strain CCAP 1002/5" /LENGTH=318 /DNA_ID=CAMNT_0013167987 /DNA_START=99 /DNA_END=1055 /DNA_ORIENTATION=-